MIIQLGQSKKSGQELARHSRSPYEVQLYFQLVNVNCKQHRNISGACDVHQN